MTAFNTVLYDKSDHIARVTLNRPDVLNVYNMAMRDDLYQVMQAVRDDPDVHGIILCGAGERSFCAGADLTEFGTSESQVVARQVRWERDVWGLFLDIEKPIMAALHGYVFGSGVEMALLSDLRIAAEDSIFCLPEAKLGMIPAAGGTQMLHRIIGSGQTLDLLLTGRRVTATEAYDVGLVHRVVSRENLMAESYNEIRNILSGGLIGVSLAKLAVRHGLDMNLSQGLDLERSYAWSILGNRLKPIPSWKGYNVES